MSESSARTTPQQAPAGVQHGVLRRMGVEVQGRVDDYLLRLDNTLARRGATPQQRRETGVSVRHRILEKLSARPGAAAGKHLSAADAEAVLGELGPAERFADPVVPPKSAAPKYTGPQSLSKIALLGLAWALMFPLMLALSKIQLNLAPGESEPRWYLWLQVVMLPLGWGALIATPVMGWLALDQIRTSGGRVYGLSLATFDMLLFPLLLLDFGLFWGMGEVARIMGGPAALGESLTNLIRQVLPMVACVLGDYFIAARVWMSVNQEA